jgi:hypothetical protein
MSTSLSSITLTWNAICILAYEIKKWEMTVTNAAVYYVRDTVSLRFHKLFNPTIIK